MQEFCENLFVKNEEKYLNTIAKNVRKLRLEQKISQEKLAELVDCSREFVNRFEARKEDASLKLLLRFALALGVSPSELIK